MLDHAFLIFFDFLYIIVGLLGEFIYIGLISLDAAGYPGLQIQHLQFERLLKLLGLCFLECLYGRFGLGRGQIASAYFTYETDDDLTPWVGVA